MQKMRIIVGGFLGLVPSGGGTWDYLQYPLGLAELGHDVFYIEDTRLWPVYQTDTSKSNDCSASVQHLARAMAEFGLQDRWAYVDEASGECFGLTRPQLEEVCRTADVLINNSCATYLSDRYLQIPVRALLDSDPMFTQVQYLQQFSFTEGTSGLMKAFAEHTHFFTYGESVGQSDCLVPTCDRHWLPTRQPICLDHWPQDAVVAGKVYTTVMNWSAAPPMEYDGQTWGQKNLEFTKLLELPSQLPSVSLAVAVGQTTGTSFPVAAAESHGWTVWNAGVQVPDWEAYRRFIQRSRGELSVAKQTYVKARTGWFSGRSACYLASGRPVVAQDTGWTKHLPHEAGLLPFHDCESAMVALQAVEASPELHRAAARRIAQEHFDSRHVLTEMLERMGA